MTYLRIVLEGDGAFPDCDPLKIGTATTIARFAGGMGSGKSSVTIELTLPDGSKALGQTSLAMLEAAVRAFKLRDEAEGRE